MFCVVLEAGQFGKQVRNIFKVLKYGTGEGWRRQFGLIASKINKYYKE